MQFIFVRSLETVGKELKLKFLLSDIVPVAQPAAEEDTLEEAQSAIEMQNYLVKVFLIYFVYK